MRLTGYCAHCFDLICGVRVVNIDVTRIARHRAQLAVIIDVVLMGHNEYR